MLAEKPLAVGSVTTPVRGPQPHIWGPTLSQQFPTFNFPP